MNTIPFANTLERPGPIVDGTATVAGPVTWMDGSGVLHEGYPPPTNARWVPSTNGVYAVCSGKTELVARRLELLLHAPRQHGENRHTRRARARAARRQ